MAAKSKAKEGKRIKEILARLENQFPDAECALRHESAFQLLMATILSAQCTDKRVNKVTPELFDRYETPAQMAEAEQQQLEEIIRSTGFFRNKARNMIKASKMLVNKFGGEIPKHIDELTELPGVARKTANVVLGTWYGISSGVVVDTHVKRISKRLGLTEESNPNKIERDLMERIPEEEWINFSHRVIHHGRETCKAQKPRCENCYLADLCPYFN